MKQSTILAVFAALAVAALPPVATAQSASTSARVAAQIQGFYDQTTTLQTAFYQAHYDRIYRRTTRSRGILTISRPGKMRFDYLAGNGKVVVSDGTTLTVYEPGDDGGPGQYIQRPVREGSLSSALGFITGTARLDRDFRFRLVDPARYRWDGHVLELRPRTPEPAYRRVFLFVDDDPATAGVVRRVLIQDHAGNLNRFDFRRMRFDRPVAESRFRFVAPRGARQL